MSWNKRQDKKHVFTLQNEGAVSDFLGIQIQQIDKLKFKFTQLGLIEKLLRTMHLEECTPATTDPLHADLDGSVFNKDWKYDSVIGMMMYLANNTCPDMQYADFQEEENKAERYCWEYIARNLKELTLKLV